MITTCFAKHERFKVAMDCTTVTPGPYASRCETLSYTTERVLPQTIVLLADCQHNCEFEEEI